VLETEEQNIFFIQYLIEIMNIMLEYCPSPDSSEKGAGEKVIFSWLCKATSGSSCKGIEKTLFCQYLVTDSWE
jgi:hypothetical protein